MKELKLVKQTKFNGDIFFAIYENDSYVTGSTIYAGTIDDPQKVEKAKEEALIALERYSQNLVNISETIKTITL